MDSLFTPKEADSEMIELSVSEVSQRIKKYMEHGFSYVKIRGEVSGLKRAPSGHVYFSLKEENAVLSVVCWKHSFSRIPAKIEDGMEVIAYGKITTYAGQSRYQLMAEMMEPSGVGSLMALMEKRKQQFIQEGLFDSEHKKELPRFPQIIGVVTSPTGAVIHDILHRVKDRFPVHILLWPVLVQGEGAAEQIADAIRGFNLLEETGSFPRPDVLIVGRGGGSIEDLWAFNEECVVRAAFASSIPLISAVGHETDVTLIDFVSDRRAPTPTGAAEIALPVRDEWQAWMDEMKKRLTWHMLDSMKKFSDRLELYHKTLPPIHMVLEFMVQRFDEFVLRFDRSFKHYIMLQHQRYVLLSSQFRSPDHLYQKKYDAFQRLDKAFISARQKHLEQQKQALALLSGLLKSYHYSSVLKRGFSVLRDAKGHIIQQVGDAKKGEPYDIELQDGHLTVDVIQLHSRST